MSRLVHVKWSKETYDVSLPADAGGASLKHELEKLTGVPVARQKLMAKGAWVGVLKDETSLAKLKPAQSVTLMGSAEIVVPRAPPKFIEDMPEAERANTGAFLPAGLENLGNTCYLNSTVQCLRAVPELKAKLSSYAATRRGSLSAAVPDVTLSLGATYRALDASTEPVSPRAFVLAVRTAFPQFAQTTPRGGYAQQDAEELYSNMLDELASRLSSSSEIDGDRGAVYPPAGRSRDPNNAVDALFGIELEESLTCAESEAEPPSQKRSDRARKLVCNIQGGHGQSRKVDHLHEGLKIGLEGTVEKRSEVLNRDAIWTKTQRIVKLGPYVCVQFMRFFWKATPDNDDHAGVKCKIVRPVSFPETLDLYEFCTDALKAKIKFNRDKYGAKLDDTAGGGSADGKPNDEAPKGDLLSRDADAASSSKKTKTTTAQTTTEPTSDGADDATKKTDATDERRPAAPMDVDDAAAADEDDDELDDDLAAAIAMSKGDAALSAPPDFAKDGLPPDFAGEYELFALVTHKGRSADGGHYVGWVRADNGDAETPSGKWLVFDDDFVSESSTEFVVSQLKGGGDEHMAYLAFYRAKGAKSNQRNKSRSSSKRTAS